MSRFRLTRESFIPKTYAMKITPKDLDVVIYLYNTQKGEPCAKVFGGKRTRPDINCLYRSAESREKHITEYLTNLRGHKAHRAAEKAKAAAFRHTCKPGDIFVNSWGWEQTNIDFYQVIETTEHTVTLRAIASDSVEGSQGPHGMSDQRVAVKDTFLTDSKPFTKRVSGGYSGGQYVSMAHGCCSLWDGRPMYCSWYA